MNVNSLIIRLLIRDGGRVVRVLKSWAEIHVASLHKWIKMASYLLFLGVFFTLKLDQK